MNPQKRQSIKRKRKKKFRYLKNTGQLFNYYRNKQAKPEKVGETKQIKTMQYKFLLTLKKIIKYGILVGLPFLATNYPDVLNLTIGGLLILVYDYLKHSEIVKRLP